MDAEQAAFARYGCARRTGITTALLALALCGCSGTLSGDGQQFGEPTATDELVDEPVGPLAGQEPTGTTPSGTSATSDTNGAGQGASNPFPASSEEFGATPSAGPIATSPSTGTSGTSGYGQSGVPATGTATPGYGSSSTGTNGTGYSYPSTSGSAAPTQSNTNGQATQMPASTAQGECPAEQAQITQDVEQRFYLGPLSDVLSQPQVLDGRWQEAPWGDYPNLGLPIERVDQVEVTFSVGQFTYWQDPQGQELLCDAIEAPIGVQIRVGDNVLNIQSDSGLLWTERDLQATVSFMVPMDQVTGTLQLNVDRSLPYVEELRVDLKVSPGGVRGEIVPLVQYFSDDNQRQAYLQGDTSAAGQTNMQGRLRFPDDGCEIDELTMPADDRLSFLEGATTREVLTDAFDRVSQIGNQNASWQDGTATTATVVGQIDLSTTCLSSDANLSNADTGGADLAYFVRAPINGELQTADGVRLPLKYFQVELSRTGLVPRVGSAFGIADPAAGASIPGSGDLLTAQIFFDLSRDPVDSGGTLTVHNQTQPGEFNPVNCLAWPPGSQWDSGCQQMGQQAQLPQGQTQSPVQSPAQAQGASQQDQAVQNPFQDASQQEQQEQQQQQQQQDASQFVQPVQ